MYVYECFIAMSNILKYVNERYKDQLIQIILDGNCRDIHCMECILQCSCMELMSIDGKTLHNETIELAKNTFLFYYGEDELNQKCMEYLL